MLFLASAGFYRYSGSAECTLILPPVWQMDFFHRRGAEHN